jgi:hypothetical protein
LFHSGFEFGQVELFSAAIIFDIFKYDKLLGGGPMQTASCKLNVKAFCIGSRITKQLFVSLASSNYVVQSPLFAINIFLNILF